MVMLQNFKHHSLSTSIFFLLSPLYDACLLARFVWEPRSHFSFTFYPQIGGQSKTFNSNNVDLLISFAGEVTQHNQMVNYLPLVEYASSSIIHSSTRKSPSEAAEGWTKLLIMLEDYVWDVNVAFDKVKDTNSHAQENHNKAMWQALKADGFQRPWVGFFKFCKG